MLDRLFHAAHTGPTSLIYSVGDEQHNEAAILKEVVDERLW